MPGFFLIRAYNYTTNIDRKVAVPFALQTDLGPLLFRLEHLSGFPCNQNSYRIIFFLSSFYLYPKTFLKKQFRLDGSLSCSGQILVFISKSSFKKNMFANFHFLPDVLKNILFYFRCKIFYPQPLLWDDKSNLYSSSIFLEVLFKIQFFEDHFKSTCLDSDLRFCRSKVGFQSGPFFAKSVNWHSKAQLRRRSRQRLTLLYQHWRWCRSRDKSFEPKFAISQPQRP